ncbi:helix-turn-helix domain-containing protein [Glycocaulis sp.]|uniref:helix-turn-helix domain-containing protein n=1 Tax=Glycocaulis sp. TaxID=1969725 RepID=UPI003D1C1AF5
MSEENGARREGTPGRWGPALRALRLRSNMKQDDAASRLQVSQSYISRLENGVIEPSPDIVSRLRELLQNPVHRPLVDQLRAIVRHSPHAVALLAYRDGAVSVIEASSRYRQAVPPFEAYRPGMEIADSLGQAVSDIVREVLSCGAFEGEVACMERVWQAPVENELRYFHSVQTPVFTGSDWLVHSATAAMSPAGYEAFLTRNGGPALVHHF